MAPLIYRVQDDPVALGIGGFMTRQVLILTQSRNVAKTYYKAFAPWRPAPALRARRVGRVGVRSFRLSVAPRFIR